MLFPSIFPPDLRKEKRKDADPVSSSSSASSQARVSSNNPRGRLERSGECDAKKSTLQGQAGDASEDALHPEEESSLDLLCDVSERGNRTRRMRRRSLGGGEGRREEDRETKNLRSSILSNMKRGLMKVEEISHTFSSSLINRLGVYTLPFLFLSSGVFGSFIAVFTYRRRMRSLSSSMEFPRDPLFFPQKLRRARSGREDVSSLSRSCANPATDLKQKSEALAPIDSSLGRAQKTPEERTCGRTERRSLYQGGDREEGGHTAPRDTANESNKTHVCSSSSSPSPSSPPSFNASDLSSLPLSSSSFSVAAQEIKKNASERGKASSRLSALAGKDPPHLRERQRELGPSPTSSSSSVEEILQFHEILKLFLLPASSIFLLFGSAWIYLRHACQFTCVSLSLLRPSDSPRVASPVPVLCRTRETAPNTPRAKEDPSWPSPFRRDSS